jgi:hypothetical protein
MIWKCLIRHLTCRIRPYFLIFVEFGVCARKANTPFHLVLGGRSRDRIVYHPSAGPTRTIWEEAKRELYGTAANAGTFGQSLCALPASIVIISDARVALPVQESLRNLLRDAPKGHLVQFCPHNNQSHITL